MTYTQKIDFLSEYQTALRSERLAMEEIEMLRAEAERITPLLSGMPGGSGNPDKIPEAVEGIIGAQEKLKESTENAMWVRDNIKAAIDAISPTRQKEILTRRYIFGEKWERIAVEMGISYQRACELHKKAVNKISEKNMQGVDSI